MQAKIALTAIMLLLINTGYAQADALTAIQKIYGAYNNDYTVRFTGSMKMYARNNPAKIVERMQCRYTIQHKNFICSIGPIQMLLNDSYYVSVDNSDKIMMVGRKKDLPSFAGSTVLNLGQLKTQVAGKEIQALVSGKGFAGILALADAQGSSGFSRYTIEYNTLSGYMKKLVLETADNEQGKTLVLEINYSLPEIIAADKDALSEKPFFSIVNNKIVLNSAYKNYQLVNQL